MLKKYYPILLSKEGELVAIHHLSQLVKNDISPIIEAVPGTFDALLKTLNIHWQFEGNEIFLDFSYCNDVPEGEIKSLFKNLYGALIYRINVVPVVQFNSHNAYKTIVKEMAERFECPICIRVSNGGGHLNDIVKAVNDLIDDLKVSKENTYLLIDLGYADANNFEILSSFGNTLLQSIKSIGDLAGVIIASGSFPTDLTDFKPQTHPHLLKRYEWVIWKSFARDEEFVDNVRYADYGTKHPVFIDASHSGSCSIKYTGETDFVIYRGQLSKDHAQGNGQYITHAKELVKHEYYSGSGFSWGDMRIMEISKEDIKSEKKKPGNAGTWVKISQNHHITILHSLL